MTKTSFKISNNLNIVFSLISAPSKRNEPKTNRRSRNQGIHPPFDSIEKATPLKTATPFGIKNQTNPSSSFLIATSSSRMACKRSITSSVRSSPFRLRRNTSLAADSFKPRTLTRLYTNLI